MMEHEDRVARAKAAGCDLFDDHEFIYIGVDIGPSGVAGSGNRVWKYCTRCGGLTYVEGWWLGYMETPTGVREEDDES